MSREAVKRIVRRVFEQSTLAAFTLITSVTVLILLAVVYRYSPGTRDFIEYWASGQLLVHHQNPYDPAAILKLERGAGLPESKGALVMGNAPPSLSLIYPLGLFSVRTAECIWLVLLIASLILALRSVSQHPGNPKPYVWALVCGFAPVLACLTLGQMAMLVLLGFALFLRFHRCRPFMAGASLCLCLLKPQLFLPFGIVLALWIWRNRQLRMLAGALSAMAASVLLSLWLDPACWNQYFAMMRLERYDRAAIPCFSVVLRDLAGGSTMLQYLPGAVACVWAGWYFLRRRNDWDWIRDGSLVVLVSVVVAPYSWFVDQCLAVPALVYGLQTTRSRLLMAALAWGSVIIEAVQLQGVSLLHSNWLLWTAPAWLIWYIAATRSREELGQSSDSLDGRHRFGSNLSADDDAQTVETA